MFCLAGCKGSQDGTRGDGAPEHEAQQPAATPAGDEAAEAVPTGRDEQQAPLIEFQPQGLSSLYQGFMTDSQSIEVLRAGLAGRLSAPVVALRVIWDPVDMSATITMHVPEHEQRFSLLADAVAAGKAIEMQQIQPLLAALGAYRADLGARFDLRFLSFHIRMSWWDPDSGSHCTIGGVLNDPDGTELSPCFECVHVGEEQLRMCRTGDKWPSPLSGSPSAQKMLSSALRSSL